MRPRLMGSNMNAAFTQYISRITYLHKTYPVISNQQAEKDIKKYLVKCNDARHNTTHNVTQSSLISPIVSDPALAPVPSTKSEIFLNIPEEKKSRTPKPSLCPGHSNGDEWMNQLHEHLQSDLLLVSIDERESNHNIENNQRRNLEKSRSRRVITVRRALLGNIVITFCKLAAFCHSGSSAIMSEFIHSIVDCGNQSLLLLGLRDSDNEADCIHQYGYGKSIYFWALVSALGTFFLGAGVSMTHSLTELFYGSSLEKITWHVWSVLCVSLAVDGYVLRKTIQEVKVGVPKSTTFWKHIWSLRDPATLAILLEDGAACAGIVIAMTGIVVTHTTGIALFDALTGVSISSILAAMGLVLVRVNHRFLLGHSVDQDIIKGIEKILLNRRSIEAVDSVQSQWTGPDTFSFKAEVDFDGTFLAATLIPRYQREFSAAKSTLDQDLRLLLSWYAEDVMRTVEREVRHIEAEIRNKYPGARYIELEPMGKDRDRFAIDDGMESQLKGIEIEALNRYLKSLYQKDVSSIQKK